MSTLFPGRAVEVWDAANHVGGNLGTARRSHDSRCAAAGSAPTVSGHSSGRSRTMESIGPETRRADRSAPLSALIPLKITGRHYGDNLARLDLLFSTLVHFAEPQLVEEILIIVRADEADRIEPHLSSWPELPLRMVIEDEHFPAFKKFTRPWQLRPWHRQQIIKLNAPAFTNTPFVLLLDPDVLAVKPIRYEALVYGDRALMEPAARRLQRRWWLDSASLLGVDAGLDRPGMQVTPAILSTAILTKLHERLEEVWGRPWMDVLSTSYCEWTEFTLYLLTAEWAGLLARHHLWADDPAARAHLHVDAATSVWHSRFATPERVALPFAAYDDPGLLAVVQSNTGFPASEVASVVVRHIPLRVTTPIESPRAGVRSKVREWLCVASAWSAKQIYRARRGPRRYGLPPESGDDGRPAIARRRKPAPLPGEERA